MVEVIGKKTHKMSKSSTSLGKWVSEKGNDKNQYNNTKINTMDFHISLIHIGIYNKKTHTCSKYLKVLIIIIRTVQK